MELLSMMNSMSSDHSFKSEILLDSNKFNELDEDAQNNIQWVASQSIERLRNEIDAEWAKIHKKEKREKNIHALTDLFKKAGFDPIYVKVIENQYSSSPYYYENPWLKVTTTKGLITIGWRKRVINLDWSESDIDAVAKDLFSQESTTQGDKYIHCWGEKKAIEYLTKLNSC